MNGSIRHAEIVMATFCFCAQFVLLPQLLKYFPATKNQA
jgi:hypothetical protein